MSKKLAPLLARTTVDEIETQHDAVGRLVQAATAAPGTTRAQQEAVLEARKALYGLLTSPRLAVVSKACHGLTQLLWSNSQGDPNGMDMTEVSGQVIKALETALARQQESYVEATPDAAGVVQAMTRCLVSICRMQAVRPHAATPNDNADTGSVDDEGEAGVGGLMASLLSMDRGVLYPALAHEATSFCIPRSLGGSNINVNRGAAAVQEVVGVVGPLASAILLQPEYSNLRGGFLLKLSAATDSVTDAVKLGLVVFQAELLGFCAVHTPTHADVAAGWCCAITNTALSLNSDAAWDKASAVLAEVIISLLAEFREHGLPVAPLLPPLQSLAEADPRCLGDEVTFIGIAALQSACVDERVALLDIVGSVTSAMSRRYSVHGNSPSTTAPCAAVKVTVEKGHNKSSLELWSLEALVYPVVSMASAGNTAATKVLPILEAALADASAGALIGHASAPTAESSAVAHSAKSTFSRSASAVALAVRRLCSEAEGNETETLVMVCKGLEKHARDLEHIAAGSGAVGRGVTVETVRADLESAFCTLAPCLLRPRSPRAHSAACAMTVAMVRAMPALGIRLLPFILYGIRKLGGVVRESGAILNLLRILPELGRHKVAAKPVAGVIQALARAPQNAVRGVGLRLAARLIVINSRTFNQLKDLLAETPVDNRPPHPAEAEESRVCRAAGMLEVCSSDPELGLEFIRPLQAFLADPMNAVTALALRAIAALCQGDCLDFDAALRIVSKKGKVAHTGSAMAGNVSAGDDASNWGDARVMAALAELCGAGAEAAAAAAAEAEEESDEESEGGSDGGGWGMGKAVETLLRSALRNHPDASVRTTVYAALRAHLPALLRAETEQQEEDAVILAPRVREFLSKAMAHEPGVEARSSLESAVGVVLAAESMEPSTWIPLKPAGAGKRGGRRSVGETERTGPSNRLLAVLPSPDVVLQAFHSDVSSSPGLAGAALWSYPPVPPASLSTVPGATGSAAARARNKRKEMVDDLAELLTSEGAGGGLGVCLWQRVAMPLGVQRYVKRLLAACLAAESESSMVGGGGDGDGDGSDAVNGGVEVERAAIKTCREEIEGLRGVPSSLVALAAASLASCVPRSFAHITAEEADRAVDRLRTPAVENTAAGGISDSGTVMSGDGILSLCAAISVRALPDTASAKVAEAMDATKKFSLRASGRGLDAAGGDGDDGNVALLNDTGGSAHTTIPNDALAFWSVVSIGVASEWACRNPSVPEAKSIVSFAARLLLQSLAQAVGSEQTSVLAATWFATAADTRNAKGRGGVQRQDKIMVEWDNLDVGNATTIGDVGVDGVGLPGTATGSRCLACFVGLSSTLPGLRATGMHKELVQVFHVVRAFQEAGVCGAALCLPVAASECLSCGLIDSPIILSCLRSLSLALDGASTSPNVAGKRARTGLAAQDTCLGVAGLVVACEGKVVLPPGFAESVFDSLRKGVGHRRGGDSGARVASLVALGTMLGCPLLGGGGGEGGGEYSPRRMRVSSITTRRMVEVLLEDIREVMEGTSVRPKNVAARVWGCLSALGEDERSAGNPVLLKALGWAEVDDDGNGCVTLATTVLGNSNASGGVAAAAAVSISVDALSVAREGTLMSATLTRLQMVASGARLSTSSFDDGALTQSGATGKTPEKKGDCAAGLLFVHGDNDNSDSPVSLSVSSLFTRSALASLEPCGANLRVPHPQMATVLGALFRGGHGAAVEIGCIRLALALAPKEQAYSTWLRNLLQGVVFCNLSGATRGYLVSVFDRVAQTLPMGIVGSVLEEMWDNVANSPGTLLAGTSASLTAPIGRALRAGSRERGVISDEDGDDTGHESIRLAAAFLSSLERLAVGVLTPAASEAPTPARSAATAASLAAETSNPSSLGATLRTSVVSVTLATIVPSLMHRYSINTTNSTSSERPNCERSLFAAVGVEAPESPLWNALIAVLVRLPRAQVENAIALKPREAAAATEGANRSDGQQTLRAFLISQLAGGDQSVATGTQGIASPIGLLGTVVRWTTRARTDRRSSAAVLPHLVRGLARVPTGSRAEWFRTILDAVGLPESCTARYFALLGGAAGAWEPSSLGFVVTGDTADDLTMMMEERRDMRACTGTTAGRGNGEEGLSLLAEGVTRRGARQGQQEGFEQRLATATAGARLFSMSVAAPKAVLRVDKVTSSASGGAMTPTPSVEILARLLRVWGILRRRARRERYGGEGAVRGGKQQEGKRGNVYTGERGRSAGDEEFNLEEARLGVVRFVRGLRHSTPVLTGRMCGQFADFARSVAGERTLSLCLDDGVFCSAS